MVEVKGSEMIGTTITNLVVFSDLSLRDI